jgi:3-dehydroquinate synthase
VRNIVITGFMGTGKTTVGKLVSSHLGRPFVDMDVVIEQREGRTIPQIFAEAGEPYFRQLEADLCRELAASSGLVIATGGGTLVPESNLQAMHETDLIICLKCEAETLWERIGHSQNRPMLARQDEGRFGRLSELLEKRMPAYSRIEHHIDVTHLTPEQVAAQILWINEASMETEVISVVHPSGTYPIFLREGILASTGRLLAERGYRGRCAIVTNKTVGQYYADPVFNSLQTAGFEPTRIDIPDGEQFKTLETVAALYDQFIGAKLDRSSVVIALGGGVVGDTVGFAAASFLRGLPLVQIPTTVLAIVDASVGGKTGVDLPQGKNLVGAFKQPEMVIVDPEVLASLPEMEFRSGMAEVVKHGIIDDTDKLFEALEAWIQQGNVQHNTPMLPVSLLRDAIAVKVRVVRDDPFEQGRRAVLNLGHTFAHALERLAGFQMRHGEAVAIGLVCASNLASNKGLCSDAMRGRVVTLLEQLELPTRLPDFPPDQIWAAMFTDKKRKGDTIRFILPRDLGRVDIFTDIGRQDIVTVLQQMITITPHQG